MALRLVIALVALSATTIIASAFTVLRAAWHFNWFAAWSLPANLLAMPIVSFLVMPGAVAGVLAMPLGLEWLPLQVMRVGLDGVIWSVNLVAGWPGAATVIGSMGPLAGFASGMGLVWLALWRGRFCLAGIVMSIAVASAGIAWTPRADLVVERTARTVAARLSGGQLVPVHPRRGRYPVERWLLADGDGSALGKAAKRPGWHCDDAGVCRATLKGARVVWLDRKAKPPADCRTANIVVSAEPLRRACGRAAGGKVLIDRFDVGRHGAHAVHVTKTGEFRVDTAQAAQGAGPWRYAPIARRKVMAQPKVRDTQARRGPTSALPAGSPQSAAAGSSGQNSIKAEAQPDTETDTATTDEPDTDGAAQ